MLNPKFEALSTKQNLNSKSQYLNMVLGLEFEKFHIVSNFVFSISKLIVEGGA